jgi:hypothetical protein
VVWNQQQEQWLGLQTALQFHMKSKEPQNNRIFGNQERLFELHTEGIKQQDQWFGIKQQEQRFGINSRSSTKFGYAPAEADGTAG